MISTTDTAHNVTQTQQRAIGEEQVRGASAAFPLVHEIQVPENAVERKRHGQAQPLRCRTSAPFPD